MKLRSILVMSTLACASLVAAQPAPKDPGDAAYQEGRKAYDLREWDKAIASFKEAYRLRSDAPSLFNIAQSYRLKGDCGEALAFYKTYKRNFATAPNIAVVDNFIVEMEKCIKEKGATQPTDTTKTGTATTGTAGTTTTGTTGMAGTTTTGTTTTGTTTTTTTPIETRVEDPGAGKRTAGIVIGGAGVALVGTGFLFGVLASRKADDVTMGGNTSAPPEFDPAKAEEAGKRFDLLAKISWGVGGAAIIGGVVLYVMGNSAKETQVSAVPLTAGARGAMFAFGRSF